MTLFEPGRNIWRMAQADHAAVIVDACDYYRVIRQAMLQAELNNRQLVNRRK